MNVRDGSNEADLICPLSQQIFLDPVKVPLEDPVKQPDGTFITMKFFTVERQVIEKWIKQTGKNPFTRKLLAIDELISDDEMKKNVSEFLKENPTKIHSQYTLEIPSANNQTSATQAPHSSDPTEDDLLAMRVTQGIQHDLPNPQQERRPNLFLPRQDHHNPGLDLSIRRPAHGIRREPRSSDTERHFHRREDGDTTQMSAAIDALSSHGLTPDLLRTHWQCYDTNYRFGNGFISKHKNALIYFITGEHPLREGARLPSESRLSPTQAICEISRLDMERIDALVDLYSNGLRGDHLRSWHSGEHSVFERGFNICHRRALSHLIRDDGLLPAEAIERIDGLSNSAAREIYDLTPHPAPRQIIQDERISSSHERLREFLLPRRAHHRPNMDDNDEQHRGPSTLDEMQQQTLQQLREYGLTEAHLRSCTCARNSNLDFFYRLAWVNLMTERGVYNKTADQAVAELNGLNPDQVKGISRGLNRADVLGLDEDKINALLELRQYGLTADHLRSCSWNQNPNLTVGEYYRFALIDLMTQRGPNNRTADQAVAELDGLDYMQAEGISKGLDRSDVIGLNRDKISAFLELRQYGLTTDHLRTCIWPNIGIHHHLALVNLMTGRGINNKTADEAIAALNGLDIEQARRISYGETRCRPTV